MLTSVVSRGFNNTSCQLIEFRHFRQINESSASPVLITFTLVIDICVVAVQQPPYELQEALDVFLMSLTYITSTVQIPSCSPLPSLTLLLAVACHVNILEAYFLMSERRRCPVHVGPPLWWEAGRVVSQYINCTSSARTWEKDKAVCPACLINAWKQTRPHMFEDTRSRMSSLRCLFFYIFYLHLIPSVLACVCRLRLPPRPRLFLCG